MKRVGKFLWLLTVYYIAAAVVAAAFLTIVGWSSPELTRSLAMCWMAVAPLAAWRKATSDP